MDCQPYRDQLSEFVDGTLDAVERSRLEDHLAACAGCRALVDELALIRRSASSLEPIDPPSRVWDRIEAAVVRDDRVSRARPIRPAWHRLALPLAAVVLLGLSAALTLWLRQPAGAPPSSHDQAAGAASPASATTSEVLGTVEEELRLAAQHYENAITRLEALARDRDDLDPEIRAVLEKNMGLIDQSIRESQAALRAAPADAQAQESLFSAFRSKVALLQDTVSLINEMRKGNSAGAARIASGLNKS